MQKNSASDMENFTKKKTDDYIISTNKSISVENLIKKIALKYK